MLDFGVTFQADPPVSRVVDLARVAEDTGHSHVWLWDSHVLWQEVYVVFALMAANTTRIHLGPCVTNPATRDPTVTASALATLNEVSAGRMECGIGRGDSARRVLGRPPLTLGRLERAVGVIKDLAAGREVDYDGTRIRLAWSIGHEVPVWIAAYGPRALRLAGRIGDGVILQIADPALIRWFLGWVAEGARAAGRDPGEIRVMAAAPACVTDDLASAREQVRWFPALVSNHVVDLVRRYRPEDLPRELTEYVKARDHYDYAEHGRRGAAHAGFVPDEVVDRFCVVGSVEQVRDKLAELQEAGVTQFNNYNMGEDPAEQMRIFGKELIPEFV